MTNSDVNCVDVWKWEGMFLQQFASVLLHVKPYLSDLNRILPYSYISLPKPKASFVEGSITLLVASRAYTTGCWVKFNFNHSAWFLGTQFSPGPGISSKSCIFVRNTAHAFLLSELCSGDVMTVRMTYTRGGSKMDLTVTSASLTCNSYKPASVY
jgi:hypothetical protein